eukprot:6438010-Alexandrium_andersonii.AAC.1
MQPPLQAARGTCNAQPTDRGQCSGCPSCRHPGVLGQPPPGSSPCSLRGCPRQCCHGSTHGSL